MMQLQKHSELAMRKKLALMEDFHVCFFQEILRQFVGVFPLDANLFYAYIYEHFGA